MKAILLFTIQDFCSKSHVDLLFNIYNIIKRHKNLLTEASKVALNDKKSDVNIFFSVYVFF